MMTSSNGNIFRVTGPLCGEFTGRIPHTKASEWRGALMSYLICVWINGWVNNREAGDLRRHRSHYDVIVMCSVKTVPTDGLAPLGATSAGSVMILCGSRLYSGPALEGLTPWGRDKMDAISQTTFSKAFSWMKMFEYRSKLHWGLFLMVQLTISSIGSDNDLAPTRRQAIIWTNDG